jgi:hypothetical protein
MLVQNILNILEDACMGGVVRQRSEREENVRNSTLSLSAFIQHSSSWIQTRRGEDFRSGDPINSEN